MRRPSKMMLADWFLAALLSGLTLATLYSQAGTPAANIVIVSVLAVAPIAVRQAYPVASMLVIVVAVAAAVLLMHGDIPSSGLGVLVAMFTVATVRSRTVSAVMFVASVVAVAVAFATVPGHFLWPQFVQSVLTVLGAWVIGESTRGWAARLQEAAARTERAVTDERARIARELHDVVAHHVSVISLQAGVAEYVIDSDRAAAREAIGVVNRSGREALGEMRRLLDVLHTDFDGELRPQPGIGDIEDLVRRVESAGLAVRLNVTGQVRDLSPGAQLCVFRVVQESLTNVLKHAGPAHARVDFIYDDDGLAVTVRDDGVGARIAKITPSAQGIRGMRERAELYGGQLTAGPRADGGFEVTLRLMTDAADTAA